MNLDDPIHVTMQRRRQIERDYTGPYAVGVRGVRTNRPLSGRGPRGCMRLHGAWPPCMHGRSKRSGCGRAQVGPITFSQTKHAHEIVCI